jgi:hypothetical protein
LLDDEGSPDLDEAFAARVLSAKQPHEVDAFMHDRVYAALRRQRRKQAVAPTRMRVMLAACFALLLVASASFASTNPFVKRVRAAVARLFAAPASPAPAASTNVAAITAPPPIVALPVAEPPVVSIPAPVAHARKKEFPPSAARDDARSDEDDGAQIAVHAFDALRNGHDAPAALRYIDAYEAEHATGALAEEMAALRIEALHASSDDGESVAARDYLRRYPEGRFVTQAKRALLQ